MVDISVPNLKNTNQSQGGRKLLVNQPGGSIKDQQQPVPALHRRVNWSLLVGSLIVSLVVLLALIGPIVAPRDPLEENVILHINGKWIIPPLPLFTAGFPLGTDDFGRDLFSRVLWGIRPTLVMVMLVAVTRLIIGVLVGLTAGWNSGRTSKALDSLIELALSIPVLLVALCVIAIVEVELGIWAFILGLALTGWVETAQQVREQTRIVRNQSYIEASRSLGAFSRQILTRHVRKQITPLLVMLFAFEMSSTLMTTAGLGFLGYYIGGDVWVTVDDFVARRISGMPELGQMLATSWVTLTKPWVMVTVGTIIFITILGFNLLGDGLRQNLEIVRVGRRTLISQLKERGIFWLDQNIWHPLAQVGGAPGIRRGLVSALVLLILVTVTGFSFLRWFVVIPAAEDGVQASSDQIPNNQDSPFHPGFETQTAGTTRNTADNQQVVYSPRIVWEFEDPSGFSGGLVLSNDQSTIYALSRGGTLYAFDLQGGKKWQVELPAGGVGWPAVASSGAILVADENGGLTRVNKQGGVEWHFQSPNGNRSHSGPILDKNENIYYTVGTMANGYVQSVSPQGTNRWLTQAKTNSFLRAPLLSTDGKFVYLREDVFSGETGELIALASDIKVLNYFSGENGKDYFLSGNNIIEWRQDRNVLEILNIAEWDKSGLSSSTAPTQVGVAPDDTGWMLYTSPGGTSNLVWITTDDQTLGEVAFDKSNAILVDLKPDLTAYLCGGESFDERSAQCAAFTPDRTTPLWTIDLGNSGRVEGGLWHKGHLYVSTKNGELIAIHENSNDEVAFALSPGSPTSPPIGSKTESSLEWSYTFPEDILGGYLPTSDRQGSLYGLSETFTLYAINPDGSSKYSVDLLGGIYKLYPEEQYGYLLPVVLQDGTVIIISDDKSIYGIGSDGSIKWEQSFDKDPSTWPVESETGTLYILDKTAGLHAFDANGHKWSFQSSAAANTATGPVFGPDGNIYYTVTNFAKGMVQAVSSEGEGLWATDAKTTLFYEPLVVSPDGKFVFLKGDVFDAQTGNMVEYESPGRVEGIIAGYDGRTYLVTRNSVMEWLAGPSGFEIGKTISWDNSKYRNRQPNIQVDRNQVIWINNFDHLLWLDFDGKVLGEKVPKFVSGSINGFDVPKGQFIDCQRDQERAILSCSATLPRLAEPAWSAEIIDVPNFDPGQAIIEEGVLYVLSDDRTLSKYLIGAPPP